jgi:para-nitrobenzyl esterase
MLVHYAATGNPNHQNSPGEGLPVWPAYDLTARDTMIWNSTPKVESDPRGDERRYAAGSPYRQPGTY